MWTKAPYGFDQTTSGRWTITNGHIRFDVHWTVNGSLPATAERNYVVTPEQADLYAERIVKALNECAVHVKIGESNDSQIPPNL